MAPPLTGKSLILHPRILPNGAGADTIGAVIAKCPSGALHPGVMSWVFVPALARAGIENLHWHDLRHTFASRLVMKGVALRTVQELMGHKTITMTLRYSHLSPAHQLEAVRGLNRPATGTSTKVPKAPGLPELFLGN